MIAVTNPPPTPFPTPTVDWALIAPVLALFGAALAVVLVRAIFRSDSRKLDIACVTLTFAGLFTSAGFLFWDWHRVKEHGAQQTFAFSAKAVGLGGMVVTDGLAVFAQAVILLATALGVLLALSYLKRERLELAEFLALLLLCACGMAIMAQANDLIVVFVALEVFSIALYVLSAFDRRRQASQEAGFKYFILGAFSSAILLYGVALTYGATGSTALPNIARALNAGQLDNRGLLLAGFALLLVGLGFKVAAAPFHMWTPDVYEGAPTPVTAFMSTATKMAAFTALLRIFAGAFASSVSDWRPIVYGLAVLSLLVGTLAAAVQTDVKRMLAYSSVSHAGYVLIGVQVANAGAKGNSVPGTAASLFYLFVYALMAIGAFGVVQVIQHRGDSHHALGDFRALSKREPFLAGLLALFLLAQAGVPFTGGFVAKLTIFRSAIDAGQYQLAIVGMLAAVIGAFVYLRLVATMYASGDHDDVEAAADAVRPRLDLGSGLAIGVAAAGVLVLGVVPGWFIDLAHQATQLVVR